ncbi:MAG: hypothetical protein RIS36_1805 [Pseudomonadota bacterium]
MGTKWQSIKKAQGAFGGGVMVVAAVALMWFGVSSDVSTDEQLDGLVKQSIEIDADNPDPNDNGKIVVAAASWSTTAGYEDEFLRLLGPLLVRRRVEMLQWVELREETSSAPTYSLEWVEGQVDFFSFQVPTGHENPLLRVSPISYQAEQSRFGGFDGGRLLKVITKLEPLTLAPELLKDQTTEISDNKLLLRRNQEMQLPSLGDTRVWYEILPQGDYTVLTVQQDERSLIGANPGSKLFIQRGLLNSNELLEKLAGGSTADLYGMLYLGGILLFVGLLSLMMPHAAKIDLQPHLNVRGPLAVVVASLGISFVVTSLFFLLSLVG